MKQPSTSLTQRGKPFFWSTRKGFRIARSFHDYGVAYRDAAKAVFVTGDGADPMAFLHRHAIEAYLKVILIEFDSVITREEVLGRGHNLCKQLPDLGRVARQVGFSISKSTLSAINQINGTDRKAVAFRYPESMPQGHFDYRHFDYRHFAVEMELVFDELEALYDACSESLWLSIKEKEDAEAECVFEELEALYDADSEDLWDSIKLEIGLTN